MEDMMHSCQNPENCSTCAKIERDRLCKTVSKMESDMDRMREFGGAWSNELLNQHAGQQKSNRELKRQLNKAIRIIYDLYKYSMNTEGWYWVKERFEGYCPKEWLEKEPEFISGDKVIYIPENKVYDFGYMGQTGKAVIYNQGEGNMQDSYAVKLEDLKFADQRMKSND